ncbi:hypothetical protein Sme01_22090 [Sphaerisporangium melleum]|uniref:Uncharacterized protein n=1 Tax=Sphaerisporangium melleum TaxID=321316 RepID=A0A917VHP6_9ACTN|nr:hypothetical protein GCM10007964_22290 [Sphaerisporangium melleum]GII69733.1 hypothetical protein Sme01_22090 [Sphaerisporangium melleum]
MVLLCSGSRLPRLGTRVFRPHRPPRTPLRRIALRVGLPLPRRPVLLTCASRLVRPAGPGPARLPGPGGRRAVRIEPVGPLGRRSVRGGRVRERAGVRL